VFTRPQPSRGFTARRIGQGHRPVEQRLIGGKRTQEASQQRKLGLYIEYGTLPNAPPSNESPVLVDASGQCDLLPDFCARWLCQL